jgi:hypothetical protein
MARSADPKCIWASVSNTHHKQKRRLLITTVNPWTMAVIYEGAYPQATPMPVPEIWKIQVEATIQVGCYLARAGNCQLACGDCVPGGGGCLSCCRTRCLAAV